MKTNVETKIRQVERRTNDSALILAMYLDEAIIMKLSVNDLVKIAQGMRQLEKDCY